MGGGGIYLYRPLLAATVEFDRVNDPFFPGPGSGTLVLAECTELALSGIRVEIWDFLGKSANSGPPLGGLLGGHISPYFGLWGQIPGFGAF